MHVDGDQSLILCPLHLLKILCGLADQCVENVQELVVRLPHDLPVGPAVAEGSFRVPRPDHLEAENPDLCLELCDELEQVKAVVVDVVESLSDDTVDGLLACLREQIRQSSSEEILKIIRLACSSAFSQISTLPSALTGLSR